MPAGTYTTWHPSNEQDNWIYRYDFTRDSDSVLYSRMDETNFPNKLYRCESVNGERHSVYSRADATSPDIGSGFAVGDGNSRMYFDSPVPQPANNAFCVMMVFKNKSGNTTQLTDIFGPTVYPRHQPAAANELIEWSPSQSSTSIAAQDDWLWVLINNDNNGYTFGTTRFTSWYLRNLTESVNTATNVQNTAHENAISAINGADFPDFGYNGNIINLNQMDMKFFAVLDRAWDTAIDGGIVSTLVPYFDTLA